MAFAVTFWTFLISSCLLVLWHGRRPERAFVAFLTCCVLLTLALYPKLGGSENENALFAIDVTILAVVLLIMHRSRAFWPIWFAGFQTIIVATGLARLLISGRVPEVYLDVAGFWSLPSLFVLVIGTVLDSRGREAGPTSAP